MPMSRRRPRGRTVVTLDSFGIPELLDFLAGWKPPEGAFERGRTPWRTYDAFLADYLSVRAEFLASHAIRHPNEAFAEWLYARYGRHVPTEDTEFEPGPSPGYRPMPRLLWEYYAETWAREETDR